MLSWFKKRIKTPVVGARAPVATGRFNPDVTPTLDLYADRIEEAKRLCKTQQWLEADEIYAQILSEDPKHAPALLGRGQLLAEAGHYPLAADFVRRSLESARYRSIAALSALAMIEFECGNFDVALSLAEEVLSGQPDNVQSLVVQGNYYRLHARLEDAKAAYEKALSVDPNDPNGLFSYARMQQNAGQFLAAAGLYKRLLPSVPTNGTVMGDYALCLLHSKQLDLGYAKMREALALQPDNANGWATLVQSLFSVNRLDEARRAADDAVKNGVNDIRLHQARGDLLVLDQDYAGANAFYLDALDLAKTDEERLSILMSQGIVCRHLGDDAGSLARFAEAEALCVGENAKFLPMVRYNRSETHLIQGDFEHGMKDYDYRFEAVDFLKTAPVLPDSRWNGQADLNDHSILVWMEQGIGDEIQFSRYASELKRRYPRATVIFGVRPSTARLMKTLKDVDRVVVLGKDPDPVTDFHVPVMSLIGLLDETVATIDPSPFLFADADLREQWGRRMGPSTGRLRVGIVWAGSPMADRPAENARDRIRSLSLSAIRPILDVQDVDFYSLQVMARPTNSDQSLASRPRLPGHVVDLTADITDFADTAAIISHLDLVIGVDTSTLHCAGAIGCPVFLLNRKNTCWRWFRKGDLSPWYQNFMIFRQEKLGDWSPVIDRVASALTQLVEQREKGAA